VILSIRDAGTVHPRRTCVRRGNHHNGGGSSPPSPARTGLGKSLWLHVVRHQDTSQHLGASGTCAGETVCHGEVLQRCASAGRRGADQMAPELQDTQRAQETGRCQDHDDSNDSGSYDPDMGPTDGPSFSLSIASRILSSTLSLLTSGHVIAHSAQ
jgi:hypothetical protein